MPGRFPLTPVALTGDPFCEGGFCIDGQATTIRVTVAPGVVAEDDGIPLLFTFTLSSPLGFATTVNYAITGTATNGVDYTGSDVTGTRTIPSGQLEAVVTINPVPDAIIEGDETVVVSITSAVVNGVFLDASVDTVTGIIADPPWRLLPDTASQIAFDVITNSSAGIPCDGGDGEVPASSVTGLAGTVTAPFPFIEIGSLTVIENGIGGTVGEVRCSCDSPNYRPTVSVPIRSATGQVADVTFSYPQGNCAAFLIYAIRQISLTRSVNFYQLRLFTGGLPNYLVATLPSTGGVVPP